MLLRKRWVAAVGLLALTAVGTFVPVAAHESNAANYSFATPVFGIDTAFDGSLLVADAGAGIVRLRRHRGTLIAALPGVTDVTPTRFGLLAVTGGSTDPSQVTPLSMKLFKVARGTVTPVADLGAFEAVVNPDGGVIESNPFDVAALWNGSALVADAAANALLIVNRKGAVDWVATFPDELVSTENVKQLSGCPVGPADICHLPAMIPAQAVPTSVAVGPDGAYYVGELKGFPAPTGKSRILARQAGNPSCPVRSESGLHGDCRRVHVDRGPDVWLGQSVARRRARRGELVCGRGDRNRARRDREQVQVAAADRCVDLRCRSRWTSDAHGGDGRLSWPCERGDERARSGSRRGDDAPLNRALAGPRRLRTIALALAVSYAVGAPLMAVLEYRSHTLSVRFGYPPALIYLTCAIQLACSIGVLVRPLAPWAAAALSVTTLAAAASHLRIHSPGAALPALLYTAIQVWFGLAALHRAAPGEPGRQW